VIPSNEDQVESAISSVERLYERVTGQTAPSTGERPYAEIPAERDPAQYVEEQMERLASALGAFERTASVQPAQGMQPVSTSWMPPVSVWEATDHYLVCVDLPGVARAGLKVSLAAGRIEVVGERPPPINGVSGAQLRWTERPGGTFRRLIGLPPDAQVGDLRAEVKNGVLEVRVPRDASPRPIPVT
jgi:HSP20 family protein